MWPDRKLLFVLVYWKQRYISLPLFKTREFRYKHKISKSLILSCLSKNAKLISSKDGRIQISRITMKLNYQSGSSLVSFFYVLCSFEILAIMALQFLLFFTTFYIRFLSPIFMEYFPIYAVQNLFSWKIVLISSHCETNLNSIANSEFSVPDYTSLSHLNTQ